MYERPLVSCVSFPPLCNQCRPLCAFCFFYIVVVSIKTIIFHLFFIFNIKLIQILIKTKFIYQTCIKKISFQISAMNSFYFENFFKLFYNFLISSTLNFIFFLFFFHISSHTHAILAVGALNKVGAKFGRSASQEIHG